jgi:hypothetical protein
MDRQRIEDDNVVERYLAGQLDERQAREFEAHYAQDPETVRAIERVLRLKEGLAVLRERGELDALLRERSFAAYWKPALALAAGIAVLMVGVWLWIGYSTMSPIAATLAELTDSRGQPIHTSSTHVLVKMRGPATILDIPLPAERSAIELRMIPSARPSNGAFRVELDKVDPKQNNRVVPLGETRARAGAEDGVVVAYLDSAKLTPGEIRVQLSPAESGAGSADVFIIHLR